MSNKIRQALCCTCGEIRTCHRPRNHQTENYWLSKPVDPSWHRELGDLKCDHCGQVTRHAILHPDGDSFRDHAERITHIALGGNDPYGDGYPATRERIRQAYRQGRQPNPLMKHLWSAADEEVARESGRTTVTTFCGETKDIPERSSCCDEPGLLKPAPVRWDFEHDHPGTGGSWLEMDCPDCYRLINERRIVMQRKELKLRLAWLLANYQRPDRLPDNAVGDLITAIEAAQLSRYE